MALDAAPKPQIESTAAMTSISSSSSAAAGRRLSPELSRKPLLDSAAVKSEEEADYDDEGNYIVCHLSSNRLVTLQEFKRRRLVSIREYYEKAGKLLPSAKGISLTTEQWKELSKNISGVEDAVKKMGGSY